MGSIRTVLCPVDFSAATTEQVALAVDLCRAFGARLVLHHNVQEVAIGAAVGWMWATSHPGVPETPDAKLRELARQVPAETMGEFRVTRGPVVEAIVAVAREIDADLIVMSTRGAAEEMDGSVTERVLERADLPVFAIHAAQRRDEGRPRFGDAVAERQLLLVPTHFTPDSEAPVAAAFDLARRFPFAVHLLHVLPRGGDADTARRRLAALVPADLAGRVETHVETGTPARVIARLAHDLSAACIVMGEGGPMSVRHWFRPGTALGVLHRAPCPIWYVPAAAASRTESDGPRETAAPDAARREESAHSGPPLMDELQGGPFWSASSLYGVLDSRDEAEKALADLVAAGAPKDHLQAWYGARGQAAIDANGGSHGATSRLWRMLEKATGERDLVEQYAAEVAGGHVCIGVRCAPGPARQAAVSILRRHGGHQIAYLSLGSVEVMR